MHFAVPLSSSLATLASFKAHVDVPYHTSFKRWRCLELGGPAGRFRRQPGLFYRIFWRFRLFRSYVTTQISNNPIYPIFLLFDLCSTRRMARDAWTCTATHSALLHSLQPCSAFKTVLALVHYFFNIMLICANYFISFKSVRLTY